MQSSSLKNGVNEFQIGGAGHACTAAGKTVRGTFKVQPIIMSLTSGGLLVCTKLNCSNQLVDVIDIDIADRNFLKFNASIPSRLS